ncbi:MAG: hypothetical protein ACP5J4_18475 [Anaerolineae bacterium]
MSDIPRIKGRPESPALKARREWFEAQVLAAPDTLESGARVIVELVTALLGVLFGILALAGNPLPDYLWLPLTRPLGIACVVALLVALACALVVVLPRRIAFSPHRLDEEARAFEDLLNRKSRWLTAGVIAFGVGLLALGIVIIAAIARAV